MIEQLVSFVIRPPRADYEPKRDLLGPQFSIKGRQFQRIDLQLVNARGHALQCCHYQPWPLGDEKLPCVIYCHGNSGCLADACEAAATLLAANITVFALDFSGSGRSGGDYVTLGFFEKDDLATAVDHLRVEGRTTTIGLWGRSMGAVTALLYGALDPSVAGMVLDSPFCNLHTLILELVDVYKIRLPRFGVKLAVHYMRRMIRQKADFDIMDLDTMAVAPCSYAPVLFGHAKHDTFIQPHHSDDLHGAYAGDKNLIRFEGDHNSPRPRFYYDSVAIFFHNVLQPPPVAGGESDAGGGAGVDHDYDDLDEMLLYEHVAAYAEDSDAQRAALGRGAAGNAREFEAPPTATAPPSGASAGADEGASGRAPPRGARTRWQRTPVTVPRGMPSLDGGDEEELEQMLQGTPADRAALEAMWGAKASRPDAAERHAENGGSSEPSDDEDQMLRAAIALSLEDHKVQPSAGAASAPRSLPPTSMGAAAAAGKERRAKGKGKRDT